MRAGGASDDAHMAAGCGGYAGGAARGAGQHVAAVGLRAHGECGGGGFGLFWGEHAVRVSLRAGEILIGDARESEADVYYEQPCEATVTDRRTMWFDRTPIQGRVDTIRALNSPKKATHIRALLL